MFVFQLLPTAKIRFVLPGNLNAADGEANGCSTLRSALMEGAQRVPACVSQLPLVVMVIPGQMLWRR